MSCYTIVSNHTLKATYDPSQSTTHLKDMTSVINLYIYKSLSVANKMEKMIQI